MHPVVLSERSESKDPVVDILVILHSVRYFDLNWRTVLGSQHTNQVLTVASKCCATTMPL